MRYFCLAVLAAVRGTLSADVNWAIPTDPQAITVSLGEDITFSWVGTHNVAESASGADFANCVKENATELAPVSNGGSYTITMTEIGTRYFICEVGGHCSAGQKIAITAENVSNNVPGGDNDDTSSMACGTSLIYPTLAAILLTIFL